MEEIESGESMNTIQMFDDLSQDIVAYSYAIIKRSKTGGAKMLKEEKEWLDEAQYQLQIIHKTLMLAKKAGRLDDVKPNEKYADDVRDKIKEGIKNPIVKSSVAPIVTMVPVNKVEEPEKKAK